MQLQNISQCIHGLIVERKNSLRVPYSKSFELLNYCQRKIYVLVFGRLLLKRIIHFNSSLAAFEGITQIFSKLYGAEHNFSNAIHLSSSSIRLYFRYVSLFNVQNLFYFSQEFVCIFCKMVLISKWYFNNAGRNPADIAWMFVWLAGAVIIFSKVDG